MSNLKMAGTIVLILVMTSFMLAEWGGITGNTCEESSFGAGDIFTGNTRAIDCDINQAGVNFFNLFIIAPLILLLIVWALPLTGG